MSMHEDVIRTVTSCGEDVASGQRLELFVILSSTQIVRQAVEEMAGLDDRGLEVCICSSCWNTE